MKRRDCLKNMGAIALFPLAHTPFPQWKVYRKLHLFIVVNRENARAYDLGQAIAHVLADEIPESRARVTRARDLWRLASLISTHQLDVALLPRAELTAWQSQTPPYNQLQPTQLNELFEIDGYVLISRDDFRPDHAALIKATLQAHYS